MAARERRATGTPLLPAYARFPVTFVDGEGCWLIADDGGATSTASPGSPSSASATAIPAPLDAAREQLERLWHVSNLYSTEPMERLAERLSDRFGGAHAFFCNSGTEAVEAAIKWARKATGRSGLVALEGSFHGRTMGALSITGQPAKRAPFEPLVPGVRFATPETLAERRRPRTAAIFLEPVQGEGGVRPLATETLEAARELADELGAMLVFDEVQTGIGRTGEFYAWQEPASGPTRSRSRRGSRTACRSARCSSPTARRAASSPATTPRRSAATRSRARPPARWSTRSTTTCSPTSARSARASRRRVRATCAARGLLLAVELGRPACPVAPRRSSTACSSAPPARRRCGSRRR